MIPCLPIESIQYIIQLSLPPLQYSTYRERYDTLLACSLVARSWRSIAQEELMKHLLIEDKKMAYLLQRELPRVYTSNEVKVLSIRVYSEAFDNSIEKLSEILNKFQHPQELWLSGFSWNGLLYLSNNGVEKLNKVKYLHLIDSFGYYSLEPINPNNSCFTSIEHLTIYNLDDDLNIFCRNHLLPSIFPSLTSIIFLASEWDELATAPRISSELAKQIVRLAVCDQYGAAETTFLWNLHEFTSLKSLLLTDVFSLQTLPPIPLSLSKLGITCIKKSASQEVHGIRHWFNQTLQSSQIKHLHFPDLRKYYDDSEEYKEQQQILRQFAINGKFNLKLHNVDTVISEAFVGIDPESGETACKTNWEDLLDVLMAIVQC